MAQDETTSLSTKPEQFVPPHGRGRLNRGGTPGNKGGGRPRSAIRRAAQLEFDKRIPILGEIADSPDSRDADRIAAVKALGQVGGVSKEPPIDRELIQELASVVQGVIEELAETLTGEEQERALAVPQRIYQGWAYTLGRKASGE